MPPPNVDSHVEVIRPHIMNPTHESNIQKNEPAAKKKFMVPWISNLKPPKFAFELGHKDIEFTPTYEQARSKTRVLRPRDDLKRVAERFAKGLALLTSVLDRLQTSIRLALREFLSRSFLQRRDSRAQQAQAEPSQRY